MKKPSAVSWWSLAYLLSWLLVVASIWAPNWWCWGAAVAVSVAVATARTLWRPSRCRNSWRVADDRRPSQPCDCPRC